MSNDQLDEARGSVRQAMLEESGDILSKALDEIAERSCTLTFQVVREYDLKGNITNESLRLALRFVEEPDGPAG